MLSKKVCTDDLKVWYIKRVQIESLIEENSRLSSELEKAQSEIQKLHRIIASANKKIFGKTSEKSAVQPELFDLANPPAAIEEEVEVKGHKRSIKRTPTPDAIPVTERIFYEPEVVNCPCCDKELSVIGEEITTQIEYVPASFTKTEHVKIKKACRSCKESGVFTGSIPDGVIPLEGCRPGASLLASIVVSKYKDHLPLHRQEEIYKRHGIYLARQTMCDWVLKVVDALAPIYKRIHQVLLEQNYLHADETTIKVQDIDKTGYLWGLHAPPNLVWFHYSNSRSSEVAKEIFKEFKGAVLTDAYAGYNGVYIPENVTRLACWAHIRRRFIEARKTAPSQCDSVIKLIAKLYEIEDEKDLVKRFEKRQKKSSEIIDKIFAYLKELSKSLLPRHPLQEDILYALKQQKEASQYITDPKFQIDNNSLERLIRPIAVGRKNYLFAGSHNGAHAAAVLYTLINSCTLNKVNPFDYIKDVLLKVQTTKNTDIDLLLPNQWKK